MNKFNLMFLDGGAGAPDPSPTDTPPSATPDPNPTDATPKPGDTPPVDPPADEAAIAAATAAAKKEREEKSEKHYTRAYQELLKTLKPTAPAPTPTTPAVKIADPDPDVGDEPTVGEMSKKELGEFMRGEMRAHRDAALVDYQASNAMKPINEYAAKEGLSQKDIDAAFEQAQVYGIDITVVDGPPKLAMAAFEILRNIGLSRDHVAANSDVARVAEEKARDLAATQQPGGGAPPTPGGEKSEEQKVLDRINDIKPKSSSSLLDKPGK